MDSLAKPGRAGIFGDRSYDSGHLLPVQQPGHELASFVHLGALPTRHFCYPARGNLSILVRGDNKGPDHSPNPQGKRKATQGMSKSYEGDLIRPLGLVTLYFGYAEFEIDTLLQRLSDSGHIPGAWHSKPIGQKLAQLTDALRTSDAGVQSALTALLAEVDSLLAQRNILIHGCLLAGGRITSGRSGVDERRTSVAELNSLAEGIFAWKERLSVFRWKEIEPLLAVQSR